jgi:hypothetical protein
MAGAARIHVGDDVHDAEDWKIGTVVAVDPDLITVRRGFIRRGTWYLPRDLVTGYLNGIVFLSLTREEIADGDYGAPPRL